jgi:tripartite-type tricarboxylate transporter receptor subunit TctC
MAGRVAVGTLGGIVPARDFIPIGQITDTPQLFVTHPSVPLNSMREFIAYAKQRPRDLIAGRVHFYMNSPPPLTPLVADGKLRALCVSSNERHPGMPNIPSAKEEGLADLDLNVWFSLSAPRGTPEPVARMLTQKLNEVLADPAIRKCAFDAGALVAPSSPEALAARMERETAAWADVVQATKITTG